MKKLKLGIVGCGFLGNIVVDALKNGLLDEYELVGVMSRTEQSAGEVCKKIPCKVCKNIEELLELKPDYVVETASIQVIKDITEKVLRNGSDLVVLSIGAFADGAFYEKTIKTARECNRRVHLASGAIGGFDVLRTTALMSGITASITTHKGAKSLRGTEVFDESLLVENTEKEVFLGNAKKAIAMFPTKVNVAVATALATAGAEHTTVSINSVAAMVGDDHRIEAKGDEVHAIVDIYSKTSAIAGWSVVALLQNLVSPIVF